MCALDALHRNYEPETKKLHLYLCMFVTDNVLSDISKFLSLKLCKKKKKNNCDMRRV